MPLSCSRTTIVRRIALASRDIEDAEHKETSSQISSKRLQLIIAEFISAGSRSRYWETQTTCGTC